MRTNKIYKILVILCSLLCLSNHVETNAMSSINEDMEQYVESMVEEGNLPGVFVAIVKDDAPPIFIMKGYQDIKNGVLVTENTRFEMGSNSKAYTGLGLLYLVKQEKIKLDDPVKKYIPWFELYYRGEEQEILVKDLLYQTTGVNPSTIGLILPDNNDDALFTTVEELTEHETIFKAGEHFLYATINYDCIGLLIEEVTGKSFEEFMNETILPKYGLKNTYAGKQAIGKDRFAATGYKLGLLGNVENQAPIYRGNTPAGYIVTDGCDLAKWLELQLEAVMKKDTCDEIIAKSQIPDTRVEPLQVEPYSEAFQYSAGWLVFEDEVISHGGNNPDFSSYLLIDGKHGYAVGVLCNRDTSYAYGIAKGISDILQGKPPSKAPTDIFIAIIAIVKIGLIVINALLAWMGTMLIRKYTYIRRNRYSFITSVNKNKKKIIVYVGITIMILVIPAILIWKSMYSLEFLSVWAPECFMILLEELVLLLIIAMLNKMLHVLLPKGEVLR